MLDIPLYKNSEDGNGCMQASIGMVVEYFLGKKYSLKELDEITKRKVGKWTYTAQGVVALYKLGLKVRYYSAHNAMLYLGGEKYIRETFGDSAEKILKFTDLPVTIDALKEMEEHNLFKRKELNVDDLQMEIKEGRIPIILIDINKLFGSGDSYTGHFVVMTGSDDKYIYFNDSGPNSPMKNKKVLKSDFEKARVKETTKYSVIVVGKN
jgi:ABC-type bacteriocin/lantibiotic exporter with double-glycine peptidase domain